MEYLFCDKGETVFLYRSDPDKFYIILEGEISILIKKPESKFR